YDKPRIDGFFCRLPFAFSDICAVRVVVEVMVDIQAVASQFKVVREQGLDGISLPTLKHFALLWESFVKSHVDNGSFGIYLIFIAFTGIKSKSNSDQGKSTVIFH